MNCNGESDLVRDGRDGVKLKATEGLCRRQKDQFNLFSGNITFIKVSGFGKIYNKVLDGHLNEPLRLKTLAYKGLKIINARLFTIKILQLRF
jgi:hypothetical protein